VNCFAAAALLCRSFDILRFYCSIFCGSARINNESAHDTHSNSAENVMARWMAIDHGSKRIGLAVGDLSGRIASPVKVLQGGDERQAIAQILAVGGQYDVEGFVVGWPLNMDDTEGPQGQLVRAMASQLAQATPKPVLLWDERLSSFVADKALAGHLTRMKRRSRQDAIAAAAILQDFFDQGGPDSPKARRA